MDHVIVIVPEIAQKSRQHGGGVRLGVVQQDDAPAGAFEPVGEQLQFLFRRHRIPVAGPEVGAEHDDAARLQQRPASPASSRNRESERTACSGSSSPCHEAPFQPPRCRGRFPPWSRSAGSASGCGAARCDVRWCGLRPRSAAPGRGVRKPALPIRKKVARTHSMGQRRQHLRRGRRPWAVVECQHHLVIPERQRLREVFQADPRRGGGIDLKNARGAERSLARTIRRLRRRVQASEDGKARPPAGS